MFNLAIQWNMANRNPVNGVTFFKEPKRSFRWWKKEEIHKFINSCDGRLRSICLVGTHTGMRIGELLSLKWEQLDFQTKYITVEDTKSATYRKVKMNAVVVSVFLGLEQRSEYVFPNHNGNLSNALTRHLKQLAEGRKLNLQHLTS